MTSVRPRATAALTAVVSIAVLAACGGPANPSSSPSTTPRGSGATGSPGASAQAGRVVAAPMQWRLPQALSRPVALESGGHIVLAGGLGPGDASQPQVRTIDPGTGRVQETGRLATAVHDAAGGAVAGRLFVFGGGSSTSLDTVQQLRPRARARVVGSLPRARSDLSAATTGGATYVLAGYDGSTMDTSVLRTTDGTQFTQVAALPIGVRYAAVVGTDGALWVFGGERNGSPVDLVQRIDLGTGRAQVVGHLPRPLSHAAAVDLGGQILVAGGRTTGDGLMATVWRFDPATVRFRAVTTLPQGISDMGAVVVGDTAYLLGGEVPGFTRSVTALTLQPRGSSRNGGVIPSAAWLRPPTGPSFLAPGSDPSVLPGPVLIADKLNNRLVVVDPQGRVRWTFPRPGDLRHGQTFRIPDDAFFSPDGTKIIATEEDDYVVSVIDIATHRVVYRYGVPGVPGSGPNRLNNPDDALLLRNGDILTPDIKNCRILRIPAGKHRPSAVYGTTGSCVHAPGHFGSPNGAFPLADGNYLVTEIQGAYVDEMTPRGRILWSIRAPGVYYPSDTNEVSRGRYLTVDYSTPGQVVMFDRHGRTLWRWRPTGRNVLRQPSLARPLPNGDILLTDDANERVIVVDPRTDKVVWQYGHTGVAGRAPGYLYHPDGLDVLPPDHLLAPRRPPKP